MKKNAIIKTILYLSILSLLIALASWILCPKLPSFYKEKNWDVLFFGTSESYMTFDPAVMDEYNLKSYNRGRMKQPIYYTYYYMKDAFDVADVGVSVFEMHSLMDQIPSGSYIPDQTEDSTMNDMRFSPIKVEMIMKTTTPVKKLQHLFYLDSFHGRWQELNKSSFFNHYYVDKNRGFLPAEPVNPFENYPSMEERLATEPMELIEENIYWLDQIKDLCDKNNVRLIVTRAPYPCYDPEIKVAYTVQQWCEKNNVEYINYMILAEEIGLDHSADCSDGSEHLNKWGAAKVTKHLAEYILNNPVN